MSSNDYTDKDTVAKENDKYYQYAFDNYNSKWNLCDN